MMVARAPQSLASPCFNHPIAAPMSAAALLRRTARRLPSFLTIHCSPAFNTRSPFSTATFAASDRNSAAAAASLPSSPAASAPYLHGLSQEQLAAVTADLVPTRVVAGPGSGKTRVLTARIAHLHTHHKVPLWQILAITFTNKAAEEMRERLGNVLGEDAAKAMFAGTFHSLCYRILRRELEQLPGAGRTEGWTVYDQDSSIMTVKKLVRKAYPALATPKINEKAQAVHSRISRLKNEVHTWHGVPAVEAVHAHFAAVHGVDWRSGAVGQGRVAAAAELALWFEQYEAALRTANALDFDDLMGLTVALLQSNPEILGRLRRKFRHILVDEFQDSNVANYRLVKLLASPDPPAAPIGDSSLLSSLSRHLFAVGDPDQAIYGWRGADVSNMRHKFGVDFPEGSVYRLRDNYRSTPNILSAAQAVIAVNNDEDRLDLRPQRPSGPSVKVTRAENPYEEAEAVASGIAAAIKSGRCRDRDLAVLHRTHRQMKFVEQCLVKRGIPYIMIGGVPFWKRSEVQDAIAYLRLATTLNDDIALERVINVPARGIGSRSLEKITAAAKEAGVTVSQLLWSDSRGGGNFAGGEGVREQQRSAVSLLINRKATVEALDAFRQAVLEMRGAVLEEPLHVAMFRIIALAGLQEHVTAGKYEKSGEEEDKRKRLIGERVGRLQQLLGVSKEFREGRATEQIFIDAALMDTEDEYEFYEAAAAAATAASSSGEEGQGIGEDTPKRRLELARAFLDEVSLYSGADVATEADGVRLMTMHASKGLEFQAVFIPGCVEGTVPLFGHLADNPSPKELEEERRLFFVSMTRARQELHLFYPGVDIRFQEHPPSRFLLDVLESGHAEIMQVEGKEQPKKNYQNYQRRPPASSSGGRAYGRDNTVRSNSSSGRSPKNETAEVVQMRERQEAARLRNEKRWRR